MNELTEFSILVICILISNTTANILTNGSLPNEDYGNELDELRQQLEQNNNVLASLQTQIQELEGGQDDMRKLLADQQKEIKKQMAAVTGPRGRDGKVGEPGQKGEGGDNGYNALDGKTGPPGPAGPRGASGNDGTAGPQGPQGFPGADNTEDVNAGVVYTRWGRTNCTSNSTLVYNGFAGSSNYETPGGGTNYQCLPTDPEYNGYSTVAYGSGSLMAGAEYERPYNTPFPDLAENQNVPCARCYTRNRAALMMIPAKRTCPVGWTIEYEGYMMAGKDTDKHSSTFECVDRHPEFIPGLSGNTNGASFYFVKADCSGEHSTGHCGAYCPFRQLTCVVCTH